MPGQHRDAILREVRDLVGGQLVKVQPRRSADLREHRALHQLHPVLGDRAGLREDVAQRGHPNQPRRQRRQAQRVPLPDQHRLVDPPLPRDRGHTHRQRDMVRGELVLRRPVLVPHHPAIGRDASSPTAASTLACATRDSRSAADISASSSSRVQVANSSRRAVRLPGRAMCSASTSATSASTTASHTACSSSSSHASTGTRTGRSRGRPACRYRTCVRRQWATPCTAFLGRQSELASLSGTRRRWRRGSAGPGGLPTTRRGQRCRWR